MFDWNNPPAKIGRLEAAEICGYKINSVMNNHTVQHLNSDMLHITKVKQMPNSTNLTICSSKTDGVEGVVWYNFTGQVGGHSTFYLEPNS